MIVTAWLETASADVSSRRPTGWKPTSTAMTTSTPMAFATSTGRFSTTPPSTSRRPPTSTGAKTPGADMLARIADVRSPFSSTMRSPVSRSAATARNGVGSASKSSMAATGSVLSRSVCVSFWPWIRPRGTLKLPLWMPIGMRTRNSRSSCLRRKLSVFRAGRSRKAALQSIPRMNSSISAAVMPEAYRPPTTAPMLVPAIASTGMRCSSSACSTPTCASPREPPPERTRPMRGRPGGAGSAAMAIPASSEARRQASRAGTRNIGEFIESQEC